MNFSGQLCFPLMVFISQYCCSCKIKKKKAVLFIGFVSLKNRHIKKHTFCNAANSLPIQWFLKNECRNSMLIMCHYPDLGGTFDWLCHEGNLLWPIRSTIQIWVVSDTLQLDVINIPRETSGSFINPLSPNSDQHQFSPNNIHMLPREMVMRVNKIVTKEKMLWSVFKFSQLIL